MAWHSAMERAVHIPELSAHRRIDGFSYRVLCAFNPNHRSLLPIYWIVVNLWPRAATALSPILTITANLIQALTCH
jgi:hypothetical protein